MSANSTMFPLSEAGDAEFFAEHFGNQVRFDHRQGRWLVFVGHRWIRVADGELHRLAIEATRKRQDDTFMLGDHDAKKAHFKWTMAGESRTRLENMLALAKHVKPISDAGADWDADPWLLGVRNGVVDLRTGELRDGRPADRITMSTNASYHAEAECKEWEQTISNVFCGDAEMINWAQCALGYSITGITHEQCFFLNTGGGSNGKGTTLNIVAHVLGDYADDLPFSALEMHTHTGIPNDMAKLVDKRFVTASETKEGAQLNDARVKALTGCDPLTARFLHREFFTFQPVAKFWLSCNTKPIITDSSDGFWRRIRVVDWLYSFKGTEDDKTLKERLKGEADGILTWLINGCVYGWQAQEGLKIPVKMALANKDYENESNVLVPFIDQRLQTVAPTKEIGAGALYREYIEWAADNEKRPLSQRQFSHRADKLWKPIMRHGSKFYLGIAVQ